MFYAVLRIAEIFLNRIRIVQSVSEKCLHKKEKKDMFTHAFSLSFFHLWLFLTFVSGYVYSI